MSAMNAMLGSPLAQAIGWALVHLVWQGAIVAGILAATLALLQRQSAHVRYLVCCAAMLVMLGLGTLTALRSYEPAPAPEPAPESLVKITATTETLVEGTSAILPQIVLFWLAGVAALSVRLAGGWLRAQRLAKRNATPADAAWQRTIARLADAVGLRRAVTLLHSNAVDVPTVLGFLKPVILLPMTLSGLSPEQVEMILAHELAHIRRHDFLVNLLQSVVETLLFYHPAVWWISARIRIEREHCCDDAAIAVGGDALQYARALTRLEELRGDAAQLAVAANGGSLLARIRRVAGIRGEGMPSRWLAGAALLTVVVAVLAAPSLPLFARDQVPAVPPAPVAPKAPPAPRAVATTPIPAQAHVDVRADGDDDDDVEVNVDTPEPPDPPDPPEPARPAPRAVAATPAPPAPPAPPATICVPMPNVRVHVAPMALPKIVMPPMDIHIDGVPGGVKGGIEGGIKGGIEGGINAEAMRKWALDSKEMARQMTRQMTEMKRSLMPSEAYKKSMRDAGITMTDHEAAQLYVMGVGPRYVKSLRDAGLKHLTAHDVIQLHARGITAGFLEELKRMQR